MIRKSAVAHKQQGKGAGSTLEVVPKVALKRKNDAKDDRLPKKGTSPFVGSQQQKSLLPVHHGVGKGLMTGKGPIITGPIQRLVTHKDYAIEMDNSIIKETNLDLSGEQATEDLEASGLYDLSRVHTRCFQFDNFRVHPNLRHFYLFILGVGADEGPPGHIRGQRGGHPLTS